MHVSIAVCCLVQITGTLFKVDVFYESLLLAFSTFVAYHLIRYLNRFKYGKVHLLDRFSNQYKRAIVVMNVVAFLGSIILFFQFKFLELLRLIPFGVVTLFYAFSFLNIHGERYSLRYIPGLKIFIIAFVWAGVVVFFMLDFSKQTFLYFLELMFFVVALTLPFDIRDYNFDIDKIKTLPIVLGVKNTKFLGSILLFVSTALHFYNFGYHGFWEFTCVNIVLLIMLLFSRTKQSTYYASFWIEGVPILYYLIVIYT